jgi:hypothetical protein
MHWRPGGAEEHLATAVERYREMGMGFWLAQAEAAQNYVDG